jgi:hypothetical protein
LKSRLSRDSSLSLTCPREGCCLSFSIKPSIASTTVKNLVISAIRVLIGSAPDSMPSKLWVQGRKIEVTPHVKRWYNIPLTVEEIALGVRGGCVSLRIAPTLDLTHRPILESLEVFGSNRDSVVIPQTYFAISTSNQRQRTSLPPGIELSQTYTEDSEKLNTSLSLAVRGITNLCKLIGSSTPVSKSEKNILWQLIQETALHPDKQLRLNLQTLAEFAEPDERERERESDDRVLKGCSAWLHECMSMISLAIKENEGGNKTKAERIWRTIRGGVHDSLRTCTLIAKERPINFLQSTRVVLESKETRSIAVAASKVILTGMRQSSGFDDLTSDVVVLTLTEMAINLLSDESSKHLKNVPSFNIIREYLDSPNSCVVEKCCGAISTFFNDHGSARIRHCDNPDLFAQLEAARLVAYQCDGCLICPMRDVRFTILEEDEGIE